MWEIYNQIIFVAEIVLFLIGASFVWGRKNAIWTFVYLALVFVLNCVIYTLPALYEKIVLEESRHALFYAMDIFPAAAKALVGDGSTGMVEGYSSVFPFYPYIFGGGLVLGVVSTSFAAISTFGRRILNMFKVAFVLNGESCDIVSGNSAEALNYAKAYKKTIIALSKSTDKAVANDLVNRGYAVIRRSLSKEFFDSRLINAKTKYNVIFPNDEGGHYDEIIRTLSYFDKSDKGKNIHFYIETDENAILTEKNYIDKTAKEHCGNITLFSRNELIARTFVEENPITRDMPKTFLDDDTSLRDGVGLNVFMLGFGGLSREIYRQFVINNQLCVYKDGEYRVFPVNYFIYDRDINERAWEITGLADTLDKLADKRDEYFSLPDMPYNTKCIEEDCYEFDCIRGITERIESENQFSYVVIDTSDVYKNIEVAERLNLLLNKCDNYRIFIYNNSELSVYDDVTCYGSTKSLFTHGVVVNEELTELARSVNTYYCGSDTWGELSYFDMYSNISLAGNLRVKLSLLGLDYAKDGKGEGHCLAEEILQEVEDGNLSYEDYFTKNKRNALLAQEHFRWNAYHLMSGYLPMKKSRITVEADRDKGTIRKTVKNNALKKHSCITTYRGVDELSRHLAEKANAISSDTTYTAADFDYYKYDDLLLRAIPGFFRENSFSVVKY